MKRKTIFIGLGALVALLFIGVAAGSFGDDAGEYMEERRGGMEGLWEMNGEEGDMETFMFGPDGQGDLDNDSIPDCDDDDDDGDGINDTEDEYPHDHDNDGIPDCRDDDDDGDGIPDSEDDHYVGNTPEGAGPHHHGPMEMMRHRMRMFMNGDLDNDSIANCEDPDDDGDGINDTEDEYPHDHDNDGIPDCRDDDDDNDGVLDADDDYYVGNTPGPREGRRKMLKDRFGNGGHGGRSRVDRRSA